MPFAAGLSQQAELSQAIAEATAPMIRQLEGQTADLTFVFVTQEHASSFDRIPELLPRSLQGRCLLGCTAEAVIGGAREVESGPGVTVWSAVMPSAELVPFQLHFQHTPDGIVCTGMPRWRDHDVHDVRAVFVLGDPYRSSPVSLLERLEEELPGVPVIGGMSSASDHRLLMQGELPVTGAVGVAIRGGPAVRPLVSQGCRPIGTPFVVTRAEGNKVAELGGRPAVERLQEVYEQLSPHDRELLEQGIHLGLAINEYQECFRRGDFLIANVLGVWRDTGALAVGQTVRTGQTVQFHVRDADSADSDLCSLLAGHRSRAAAALLFSCNGRGTRLFPAPNHDAAAIQNALGPLPLAGFFAAGELGPIGGRNFIHGFTASVALFDDE